MFNISKTDNGSQVAETQVHVKMAELICSSEGSRMSWLNKNVQNIQVLQKEDVQPQKKKWSENLKFLEVFKNKFAKTRRCSIDVQF